MNTWLLLSAAIVMEVAGTLSLRAAVDHAGWYALVVAGYVGAFATLSYVLRLGLGVGVAYGIWSAAGVALTAIFSHILFGEPLTKVMTLGIAMIIGGVMAVELGAQH